MNKWKEKKARELLPIIQAYAEGKTIQQKVGDEWCDLSDPDFVGFDIKLYRVKPSAPFLADMKGTMKKSNSPLVRKESSASLFLLLIELIKEILSVLMKESLLSGNIFPTTSPTRLLKLHICLKLYWKPLRKLLKRKTKYF